MIFRAARSLALGKLYGKKRIVRELALKRFSDEAYDAFSFDSDELEDIDFASVCLKLLKKKGGAREDGRDLLVHHSARHAVLGKGGRKRIRPLGGTEKR